jgi:hypothetical protein
MNSENRKRALLVMGCPQVPVQTPAVMYIVSRLRKNGYEPVVAGTSAADMIIKYSDPESYYVGQLKNIDSEIAKIADEGESYDLCFVFIHNDSGVAYAATMNEILECDVIPVIFGKEYASLADEVKFTSRIISAEAVHNPKPLINEINKVMEWAA